MIPSPGAEKSERKFELALGLGADPWPRPGAKAAGAFRAEVQLSPVAFLGMARGKLGKLRLADRELIIENDELSLFMRIDRASGRLLETRWTERDRSAAYRLRFEAGALARRLKELSEETAKLPDAFDPKRPVSSTLVFVLGEVLAGDQVSLFPRGTAEERKRARGVIAGLLSRPVFQPFDGTLKGVVARDGEEFRIPLDLEKVTEQSVGIMAYIGRTSLVAAGRLFKHDTWITDVVREAAMVLSGKPTYTSAQLARLYGSKRMGPLGFLVSASLVKFLTPRGARAFATRGSGRLDPPARFLMDLRAFLDTGTPPGESARLLVEALAALKQEDVAALTAVLEPEHGKLLGECLAALQVKDQRLGQRFRAAMELLWKKFLRARVEAKLREIARPPDPALRRM
jgi:hypothetical protein